MLKDLEAIENLCKAQIDRNKEQLASSSLKKGGDSLKALMTKQSIDSSQSFLESLTKDLNAREFKKAASPSPDPGDNDDTDTSSSSSDDTDDTEDTESDTDTDVQNQQIQQPQKKTLDSAFPAQLLVTRSLVLSHTCPHR